MNGPGLKTNFFSTKTMLVDACKKYIFPIELSRFHWPSLIAGGNFLWGSNGVEGEIREDATSVMKAKRREQGQSGKNFI